MTSCVHAVSDRCGARWFTCWRSTSHSATTAGCSVRACSSTPSSCTPSPRRRSCCASATAWAGVSLRDVRYRQLFLWVWVTGAWVTLTSRLREFVPVTVLLNILYIVLLLSNYYIRLFYNSLFLSPPHTYTNTFFKSFPFFCRLRCKLFLKHYFLSISFKIWIVISRTRLKLGFEKRRQAPFHYYLQVFALKSSKERTTLFISRRQTPTRAPVTDCRTRLGNYFLTFRPSAPNNPAGGKEIHKLGFNF